MRRWNGPTRATRRRRGSSISTEHDTGPAARTGRHRRLAACLLVLLSWTAGSSAEQAAAPDATLPPPIRTVLEAPALAGARVGLLAADVDTGEIVAALAEDELFSPASVNKLFTAAAALWRLGPHFVWRTPVAYRGRRDENVVDGDLWVLGRGAPDLVEEQIWVGASAIADLGIERISGDLVVDDRFFDDRRHGRDWPGGAQTDEAYHAPVGALMANYSAQREAGEWRAVAAPARYFGSRFRELLERAGVRLDGAVRRPLPDELTGLPASDEADPENPRSGLPGDLELLYTFHSEPLGRIVLDLNKFSNNVVAEALLKTLGAVEYGPPGTSTKGLAVVARFLEEEVGIPLNSYVQTDGSGLSRSTRFTPRQVVDLLVHAWNDFHLGPELASSLKISGLDGWNPRRFRDPPLLGEMRLKSGHIRGVNTLAGYVHTDSGRTLAFCVMINDHRSAQWRVDDRMAELARALLERF